MITNVTGFRIQEGEIDKMGHPCLANFFLYLKQSRIDMFKNLPIDIEYLEKSGTIVQVISENINHVSSAHYRDLLCVTTELADVSETILKFSYQIRNQFAELICTATTELGFYNKENGKPLSIPSDILQKIRKKAY
jgi:YbgC/YbaW family acyl-CoA thioester hydrolase